MVQQKQRGQWRGRALVLWMWFFRYGGFLFDFCLGVFFFKILFQGAVVFRVDQNRILHCDVFFHVQPSSLTKPFYLPPASNNRGGMECVRLREAKVCCTRAKAGIDQDCWHFLLELQTRTSKPTCPRCACFNTTPGVVFVSVKGWHALQAWTCHSSPPFQSRPQNPGIGG